jgi:protein-S-isoprenylcysteine O-methyltransferase Ste14
MKSALFLDHLPELQQLDDGQRRAVLRQWRSELMRSWSFYLRAVALRVGVIAFFAAVRFSLFPGPLRWFDSAWIVLAWILGYIACAWILYWKRRDLLRTILHQATPKA